MCELTIKELVEHYPEKGKIPCAAAHFIAALAEMSTAEVGKFLNSSGVRLTYCQLGLFGYGRKGTSTYKITGRPVEVDASILDRIKSESKDSRITCLQLWKIAEREGVSRAEAGNAADWLKIKVKGCQFGAF